MKMISQVHFLEKFTLWFPIMLWLPCNYPSPVVLTICLYSFRAMVHGWTPSMVPHPQWRKCFDSFIEPPEKEPLKGQQKPTVDSPPTTCYDSLVNGILNDISYHKLKVNCAFQVEIIKPYDLYGSYRSKLRFFQFRYLWRETVKELSFKS